MSTYTFEQGRVSLDVSMGRETITVDGYMQDRDGDTYRAHSQRYGGYTLSECLCKALIDMGAAPEWEQAIYMIESVGVPYVTDEDGTDY